MKIVKRGGAGVGAPPGDWTHLVAWRDPTKPGPVEMFVEADDVVALTEEVRRMMPANAGYALVCGRTGRHVGGYVVSLVPPVGYPLFIANRPVRSAMTWTYETGVGLTWHSVTDGVAA